MALCIFMLPWNMGFESVTDRDIVTICAEDMESPRKTQKTIKIGFSAGKDECNE